MILKEKEEVEEEGKERFTAVCQASSDDSFDELVESNATMEY